jgi:hypothetical protein
MAGFAQPMRIHFAKLYECQTNGVCRLSKTLARKKLTDEQNNVTIMTEPPFQVWSNNARGQVIAQPNPNSNSPITFPLLNFFE